MNSAFLKCYSLTETPHLPNSVDNISNAFSECKSLTRVVNIPTQLKYMSYAFERCSSLVSVPDLPDTIEHMDGAFQLCTSLVKAPAIPASVSRIAYVFLNCSSLTGTIEINAVLADDKFPCNGSCDICENWYVDCMQCSDCCSYADFLGIDSKLPITLTGTCTKLEAIAKAAPNGNVVVG